MNELMDFVLDYYRVNGALVEPPRYGVHEALLPDALAEQLGVPALQEIVFDAQEPAIDDGRLHLTQGHPLIDRLVERARKASAPARAYVNAVRLDKRGLADAALHTLSLANARLVELADRVETPALCHYLVFTLKVTLTSDEKQEHLVTVAMDAQAGWPVDWGAIRERATLDAEPAYGHLTPARPHWIDEPRPLTAAALAALFERAQHAALTAMAGEIESVTRRAARYLELDRARLEQYYDDMAEDLKRRLQRAEGDRRAALQDKIASVQGERQVKLADAEARYRLRTDLELVTVQVVAQPKLMLPVQIENRNTVIERLIVWDPLLRRIEPLRCDACGQPGYSLQLCNGGHLAHAGCLLEEQCVDCKRIYCRLCEEQMHACAVCGRPVCASSLNRCAICKRGTCHEHTGLCHAAGGAPAVIAPPVTRPAGEAPASKKAARRAPAAGAARAGAPAAPARLQPRKQASRPAIAPRRPPQAPSSTANWKLAVEIEWSKPVVTAFVLATRKRGPAVRIWQLGAQGISIACNCEKPACESDQMLLRPAGVREIEAQMQGEIEKLRREYGVPARNVSYTLLMHGMPSKEPRLILRGLWKDEARLNEARAGFDVVYGRQHGAPPTERRPEPEEARPRPLQPDEVPEAERFLKAAFGLLKLEGTLKEDALFTRVYDLLHPGDWCTSDHFAATLRQNTRHFKVLASGLVATHDVSNVQALAARKRACRLPPRRWPVEELLAVAEGRQPLSELEARVEEELRTLTGPKVSVRAIQGSLRRDARPADVVSHLEGYYSISDPETLRRVAELVDELYRNTPRWELGGRTPAEVKQVWTAEAV
jgi:hypothetical protein